MTITINNLHTIHFNAFFLLYHPCTGKISLFFRFRNHLLAMNKRGNCEVSLHTSSASEAVNKKLKGTQVEEIDAEIIAEDAANAGKTDIRYVTSETDPFLRVEPYWFDYCTWAKGRWFNRSVISVFQKEFRDRPSAYYSQACRAGLIRVNDSKIEEDYLIRQGDRVQHRIHRHEPPVLNVPKLEIIHVADGLLVVCKPASIPMHPSGRYRHNTLTALLQHRHPDLFPTNHISCVNRLDRLVSGIVIISRSAEKADELRRAMQEMKFRKFYLARVKGSFEVTDAEFATLSDNAMECTAPLLIAEHKLGISCVADPSVFPAAKASKTRFTRLSYDPESDTSIILCEPVTGRTHQIRLHLQYLGFPIINDPLYNNAFWRELMTSEEKYKRNDWLEKVKAMAQEMSKNLCMDDEEAPYDSDSSICPDCENPRMDPQPENMRIDLHAYKYSGPMGTFSTSLPDWAGQVQTDHLERAEEEFNKLANQ